MAANLLDQPLIPPPDESQQDQEPKVSGSPTAAAKPQVSKPNWASIKPRDVLTDDEFHQLDTETRRYVLKQISPDFAKASKADQDNDLQVDKATWQDYFTNTPATDQPGLLNEIWNWTKKKAGETKDLISGAFTPPTQKMRAVTPSGPGVPATLAPPPAQEPIPLRQYIPPTEPEPTPTIQPPPTGHVTLPPDKEAGFQKWYADIAAKTGRDKNPDDPRHYYDYRAAYLAGAVPDATGHMSSQFKDLDSPERYREGIDTITGQPMQSFKKPESFQDWLNKQPRVPQPSAKTAQPPQEIGGDIGRLSKEIGAHRQDVDALTAEIKDRWPNGPDTTNKQDVDEYNSRVVKAKSIINEAGPKVKSLKDLIEVGQEVGAIRMPGAPVDKDLRALMGRMKAPGAPTISAMPKERAEALRHGEVPEGYGQPSLAEKVYVSAVESFGNAWAFNIAKFQPEGYAGEGAVRMVAGMPGFLGTMGFLGGGTMTEMAGIPGKIGQIPVVANWLERIRALPAAQKAIKTVEAAKGVDQVSAKLAVKVFAQQALKNPNFEKTLIWGLENPAKLSWAVPAVAGLENTLALATAGTITALGTGESVPKAITRAVAFGVGGELLKVAPGIRNLAQAFKMDMKDPKISELLRRMAVVTDKPEADLIKIQGELAAAAKAGWPGTILDPATATQADLLAAQAAARDWIGQAVNAGKVDPNAFRFSVADTIRDMARARHPEYEQFKKFIEDYANESNRTAIGTALQSSVAYGLAAAGITAVETPGDLTKKLSAAGEEGFITFLQIGGFHIPSIARALQVKYGRDMTPADMSVAFADMSGQERKQIIGGITPEDLADITRRANEFSGKTVEPEVEAAAPEAPPAPEQYKPIPTDIRTQPLAPPPAEEPVAPVTPPSIPPEAPTGLQGGAPEIPIIPGAPPTAAALAPLLPPPGTEQTPFERHQAWQVEQNRRDKEIADREAEVRKAEAITPGEKAAILAPGEELPEGVSYNGVQKDENGKIAFDLYTDAKTGSTFVVKPGELITDKLEQTRAKFAAAAPTEEAPPVKEPWQMTRDEWMAQRPAGTSPGMHSWEITQALREGKAVPPEVLKDYPKLQKLQTPTLETPLETPPGPTPVQLFSYAADLPNVALEPARQRMAEPLLQEAIDLEIADPIIEGLLEGKSIQTLSEDIKKLIAGKVDWSLPQIRNQILQIRDLKGIPRRIDPGLGKFTENAKNLKRAANGEILAPPPLAEEIVPEKPKVTIKLRTVGQKETAEDLVGRNRDKYKTAVITIPGRVSEDGSLTVSRDEALELARFFSDAQQYLSRNGQIKKGIQAWEIANEIAQEAGFSQSDIAPMGGKVSIEPAPLEAPPATFEAEHPLSDLSGGPLLPPEPEAVPRSQSARAKRARDILRKELGKRAAEIREMAMEGVEPEGPTREQLRTNPVVFRAMTDLGDEYYNAGVTDKAAWHATLYRDMEDIAEGLGEDLEPLFPTVWEAVTGNTDYIGGNGGIYGSRYGDVEDTRGGRRGVGDNLTPAERGGETVRGGEPPKRPEPRPTDELSTEPGVEGATGAGNLESAQREARYTFRGKPPVILTRSQRRAINEQVQQLVATKQPGDPLSDEEKNILRQYTASGGLSESDKERGVLYEHYSSYRMGGFQWDKLRAMGFPMDNLTVMDPAHGIGNCSSGFAPPDAKLFATEIDPVAVKVSRLLFPDLKISELPFEEFPPRRDIDVFASNVPFNAARGALRYSDEAKEYKDIRALHDFFFVKAVDMTRPNGIVMFITSTGTMDKADDTVRKRINQKAEFLGAYRTPGGEFSKNTQYEGSTDIIFLRKRTPEEIESWTDGMYQDEFIHALDAEESGLGAKVSSYYMKHPEKVWGTLDAGFGSRYETQMGVRPFQKEGPEAKKVPDHDRYLQAIADALSDDIRYTPKETQAIKIETEEALESGNPR